MVAAVGVEAVGASAGTPAPDAAVDGGARLTWWAAATLIELAGTWAAHPLPGRRLDSREVAFAGGHLLERGRLFMIIAFGETIMTARSEGSVPHRHMYAASSHSAR
ncbi:low temperature requirement protein A [Streptomyces sp. NPDC002328]|uniref:low temperature requirement protein A n=1 Tax=Streptomyces sp. NPDC002328 TaxID=3364642 RepID=UPI00368CC29F